MKHVLLLPLLAAMTYAEVPNYLPLQTGNHWLYRATGRINAPLTIDVGAKQTVDGKDYFEVTGLVPNLAGETVIVRYTDDGKLVRYRDGAELLLADFGAVEGSTYTSYMLTECPAEATVKSKSGRYDGAVGSFDGAIDVPYQQSACRDAGLESELFLPSIGLARRVTQSIAGPVTYDLVYARVGAAVLAPPQVSFSVSIDQPVYRLTDTFAPVYMQARIDLRNATPTPLPLVFPSSQDYDVQIRDQKGNILYTWSSDKLFLQMNRDLAFTGEKNWLVVVPLSGIQLAPGRYAVEAILSTAGERTQWSASVSFLVE